MIVVRPVRPRRKGATFPGRWKTRLAFCWASKKCPYCGLRRWSSRVLRRQWCRWIAPGKLQVVNIPVPRERWPADTGDIPCRPKPRRECACVNRRLGP